MTNQIALDFPEFHKILGERYYTEQRGTWVFRGHSRPEYELIPTVGRLKHTSRNRAKLEKSLFAMFRREAIFHIPKSPPNSWEWLALAQHHGLPTRLLDWTYNPFVALYFTVKADSNTDGVIFALSAPKKASQAMLNSSDPLNIKSPFKYIPSAQTPRIVAQEGLFTLQPKVEQSLSEQLKSGWRVERITIPVDSKQLFLYGLFRQGVHEAALFPGLDGLSAHLRWQHTIGPIDSEK